MWEVTKKKRKKLRGREAILSERGKDMTPRAQICSPLESARADSRDQHVQTPEAANAWSNTAFRY